MPPEAYQENALQRFARTRGNELLDRLPPKGLDIILGSMLAVWVMLFLAAFLLSSGWLWATFCLFSLICIVVTNGIDFISREVRRKLTYDLLASYDKLNDLQETRIKALIQHNDTLFGLLRVYQRYVDGSIDAEGLLNGVREVGRTYQLKSQDDNSVTSPVEEFEKFMAASVEDLDEAIRRELYDQKEGQ